jgi:hypothetical protein
MLRKPRYDVAMVHPPAVEPLKVLSNVVACEWGRGTELFVSLGIEVDMVDTEQKRILCLPLMPEGLHVKDRVAHGYSIDGPAAAFALAPRPGKPDTT